MYQDTLSSQSSFKYTTSDDDHSTNQPSSKSSKDVNFAEWNKSNEFASMIRKRHETSKSDASKLIKKPPKHFSKCIICDRQKQIIAKQMCRQCYTERRKRKMAANEKIGDCRICGQVKATGSKGMCNPCYLRERRISIEYKTGRRRVCDSCKTVRLCPERGICKVCYNKVIKDNQQVNEEEIIYLKAILNDKEDDQIELLSLNEEGQLDRSNKYKRLVECGICNEKRLLCAKNMCGPCYKKELQLRKKTNVKVADFCSSCGEIGVECYDGKCGKCHYKEGQKQSATVHAISVVSLTQFDQFNAQLSHQKLQSVQSSSQSKEPCNQLDEVTLRGFISTLDLLIQENNQRKPDPDVIVLE
ncbi:hypothetical protein M3Y97_01117900 [Aphelenchoides bicaudatus]|nr:hypothetical protein M3Y97_01117900 [Aphelenchoides bicaudatus]